MSRIVANQLPYGAQHHSFAFPALSSCLPSDAGRVVPIAGGVRAGGLARRWIATAMVRITSYKSLATAIRFATHTETGFPVTLRKQTTGTIPVRNKIGGCRSPIFSALPRFVAPSFAPNSRPRPLTTLVRNPAASPAPSCQTDIIEMELRGLL
jgi:hypothetical protein